jgi:hypothetical protein
MKSRLIEPAAASRVPKFQTETGGALYHLLRNRIYRGEVLHKGGIEDQGYCPKP